ncbi:MAG: hypothetical protein LBC27_06370, partial [Spirochaetaceae bacterium]|nr:hypothetical protein [Spirochaetaceae bacterium]
PVQPDAYDNLLPGPRQARVGLENLKQTAFKADYIIISHRPLIYLKEENPPKGLEPIERFLMTNDGVNSAGQVFEKVKYYVQRRKTGRFHYVLKSGCSIEKLLRS